MEFKFRGNDLRTFKARGRVDKRIRKPERTRAFDARDRERTRAFDARDRTGRVRKKPATKQVSSPPAGSSRGFSSVPSGSGLARDLENPATQISEEVQTHPVYPVLSYKELLQSRLRKIAEEWFMTDTKDDFDAVLLVTGVSDDEEEVDKTIAMHYWLFGFESPETMILLQPGGKVTVCASSKKLKDFFQDLEGPDFRLVQSVTPASVEASTSELKEVVDVLRIGGKSDVVLGFPKRTHKGTFAQVVADAMQTLVGFRAEDCSDGISRMLAKKDDWEVNLTKGSCSFVMSVMNHFQNDVLQIVNEQLEVSHETVCKQIEDTQDDVDTMMKFCSKTGLQSGKLLIEFAYMQNGQTFAPKLPCAIPTNDHVPMTGTYVLNLTTKYFDYAATVVRTLIVNPSADQKEAHSLTVEVVQHVINLLKPGVMFKNIYQEAKGKVRAARPDLLPRLVSNVGNLTGLEVRDSMAQIDENSERWVEAGNVFVISAGFDAASTVAGQQPWGVALAQTVLVAESGAAQVLTEWWSPRARACSSKPEWWYD